MVYSCVTLVVIPTKSSKEQSGARELECEAKANSYCVAGVNGARASLWRVLYSGLLT